ncbi:MAG: serine/threonine protein kinase [Verrucomicrobia bacterium]|nr:serine/threonine protein kinase [Verrucomicrobiota bacterium]
MENSQGVDIEGFELLERLGGGSMGEVYRARDLGTGQIVGLKLLYPFLSGNITYLQRFAAEAEAAQRLDHPNLVKVFRAGQSGLTHFISMEFVDGSNLLKLIRAEGALTEATTAAIGMCVASALHSAWERERLIHRDIKPENLLISSTGVVKVCDLGIAKRMVSGVPALTRTGMTLGSPHYVAPEQARGEKEIDMRVDIYALGATLYHAVTGQTVHDSESEFGLMIKHATEPVKDPRTIAPNLGNELADLLVSMLDLDRNRRPANWYLVHEQLSAIYEAIEHPESDAQQIRLGPQSN